MRRIRRVLSVLLLLLLLSGCWSRREINDLGLVTALGLDLTEERMLQVTLVVAQPAAAAGGKAKESPGGQRHKVLLIREGRSVTEAMRMAELASPRQLNLTHAQVVVLGERLVEEGINTYPDYLLREPQVRLNSHILILRGASVPELLAADPLMESLQSQALTEMEINQAGLTITLREYFVSRSSDYKAPLLPVLELRPHPSEEPQAPKFDPELSGAAVMQNDRVVTYLTREQVRGAMWLRGSARGAVITIHCPTDTDGPDRFISLRVIRSGQKIEPVWDGRTLTFRVHLTADMRITEMQCPLNVDDPVAMAGVTRVAGNLVGERVTEMLQETQADGVDPFEFGEQVRAWLPALWRRIGGKAWGDHWADAALQVTANLQIEHLGTIKNPANADLIMTE